MKLVRRILAFALALLLLAAPVMGCEQYQQESNDSNTVAVIIEGEKVMMDEAKLYTYAAQYKLEDDYVFYILYYYGGYDSFWKQDWTEALNEGMAELYQTKVLCNYAKANNITLTAEETAKIDDAINEYKGEANAAIIYSGASEELVKKYFTENALANKVYCELIKSVDTNFDKAEFTRKNVEGLSIIALTEEPDEETDEEEYYDPEDVDPGEDPEDVGDYSGEEEDFPGVDDEGNLLTTAEADAEAEGTTEAGGEGPIDGDEPMLLGAAPDTDEMDGAMVGAENESVSEEAPVETEAETEAETETETEEETTEKETYSEELQKEKREAALADVKERVEKGESLDDIVTSYRGDKFVTVSKLSSNTYAPTDKVEEGKEKTSYKQDAWEMKTGDVITCSYEGEESSMISYVLRCISDDDADLRKEAEDEELSKRKVNLFNEKYAEIQKAVKEFHIYTDKVTSAIKYKGQIHDAMTITGEDMEKFYETSSEAEEESGSETAAESSAADQPAASQE